MGSVYLVMVGSVLSLFLILLLYPLKNVRQVTYIREKLEGWLCWNFIMRLLLQGSLELCFALLLNFPFVENILTSTNIIEMTDYAMTVLVGLCLVMMPFNILFFWGFLRFKELSDPEF